MKFKIFISIFFIIVACETSSRKSTAIKENLNTEKTKTLEKSKVIQYESNPDFEKMRAKYVSLYDSVIHLYFTKQINENDTIYSSLKYYCLKDSAIEVPSKFVYENDSNFITHNFETEILLVKNSDTIYHKKIDKIFFNKLLSDELKKYANIMDPTEYSMKFDLKNNNMVYNFSITIPITDIGAGVKLFVNLDGQDSISLNY